MKRILNKKNLILILFCMTLFFMMSVVSYAESSSINALLRETVAGWHSVLKAISIIFMMILLLVIVIKATFSRTADEEKMVRNMLRDWFASIVVILAIQYFMIFAIYTNEELVTNFEDWGQSISGMEEGQEISLYEATISKAYEIKFIPGTVGMILYMVLVYFTYRFAFIYLKRYVNVIVLILIAPIVTCVNGFKKVLFGKSTTLKRWIKEFIYNVFLQSIHAAVYGGFVGLAIKYSGEEESFIGALLAIILFALIIVITHIIRYIFDTFGGSTAIPLAEKADWLEKMESSTFDSIKRAYAADNNLGFTKNLYNNITDKVKTAATDKFNEFRELPHNLKEKAVETYNSIPTTLSDVSKTFSGKNKTVTEEEIAAEEERLKKSKGLRKVILKVNEFSKDVKGNFKKVKGAIEFVKNIPEEVKKYVEKKKQQVEEYIQKLDKDIEVIKLIPSLLEDAKKLKLRVKVDPVTGKVEYDEKYKAIFDTDIDPSKIPAGLKECIDLTLGNITAAVLIGKGFSSLLQCTKIAFYLLAEENYRDMVHPETPVESRRVIEGFKTAPKEPTEKSTEKSTQTVKPKTKLKFKGFDNTCINRLERISEFNVSEAFLGIRTLKNVTRRVVEEKVTYSSVPTDGVIKYTGKRSSRVDTQSKIEILIAGWHKFKTDAQMLRNINLLNQYESISNGVELTNLSPEMLKILENAGMIKWVEPKNGFDGGYIILTYKINEAVMQQRVNEFLINNPDSPLAEKMTKFLEQNSNSDIALRISDYVVKNPDSVLASVIDNIVITEDGKLLQKVNSFVYDENKLNLAQLGEIQEDRIIQKIITEDGKIVEQIIDLQGNIITPAVDEEGNQVEFSIGENGLVIQTIVTPDGSLIQQVVANDGTVIRPIMIDSKIDKTQNLETVEGIISRVAPQEGIIQIIDNENQTMNVIYPENGNVEIIKDENGDLKIVTPEGEVIIDKRSIVQVINSGMSTVQVIDLEENSLRTIVNPASEAIHSEVYIDNVTGVITEIKPNTGIIQIVDSQSGEIREITPDSNVIIEKLEDGTVKLIVEGTSEENRQEIIVSQESTIQVVNTQDSMMQVIDLQQNVLQTIIGAETIQTNLNLENENGTITQMDSSIGIIQVVDNEGNVQRFNSTEGNIQVVKEDGIVKLIIEGPSDSERREIIVDQNSMIQVVKPEESIVDIIDLKNMVIETSVGETAVNVLDEYGIDLSSTQRKNFNARNENAKRNYLKNELTKIAQGVALNLETGELQPVFDTQEITDVLTVFAEEEALSIDGKPAEVAPMEHLNNLIGQLNFASDKHTVNASVVESEIITRDLLSNMGELILAKAEKEKSIDVRAMEFSADEMISILDNLGTSSSLESINVTGYENKLKDTLDSVKYTFDLGSAAIERDVVAKATEAIQNGEIQNSEDIAAFLQKSDNLSDFTKSIHQLEGLPPADNSTSDLGRLGISEVTVTEKTKLDLLTAAISPKSTGRTEGKSDKALELEVTDSLSMFEKIKREISAASQVQRDDTGTTYNNDVSYTDTIESGYQTLEDVISASGKDAKTKEKEESEVRTAFERIVTEIKSGENTSSEAGTPKSTDPLLAALEQISVDYRDTEVTKTVDEVMNSILGENVTSKKKSSSKRVSFATNKKFGNSGNKDEVKAEEIKFSITGAVKNARTFDVKIGTLVRAAIWELAGGYAENADLDAIRDKIDKPIDKNNTSIHVPFLSDNMLEERNRKKDVDTIECYIDGEVNSTGTKFIKSGLTVADLLKLANGCTEKADMKAVTVNGNVVELTYILHDKDVINVPERNLEKIMLKECANYMQVHKGTTLEIILQDAKIRADIITQIKFKCASIQFNDKELDNKLIKLLKEEIEKVRARIKSQEKRASQIDYVAQTAVPTDTTDLLHQIMNGMEKSKVIIGKTRTHGRKTNGQVAQEIIIDSMKEILKSASNEARKKFQKNNE